MGTSSQPLLAVHGCSLAAFENYSRPNESGCVHGGPVRNARVSCSHRCDERTRVHKCVNKSLFQPLESSPVIQRCHPPAVLPTLVPSLLEIGSQLAQQMHTLTAKIGFASHVALCSASVAKGPQKQSQSISFLKLSWGSMPPDASLVPRPLPDFISQLWRKIRRRPGTNIRHGPEMVDSILT